MPVQRQLTIELVRPSGRAQIIRFVPGPDRQNPSTWRKKQMNTTERYLACTLFLMVALWASASSFAQSPFDGTWRINAAQSKLTSKPFTFYTSQGWSHCVSCTPAYDVQADGQDQI